MLLPISELRNQQGKGAVDLMSTLRIVEINAIDICNRTCGFCPRSSETYVNKTTQASISMITKIASELHKINFNGRVSFVGFGEPLLYKNLYNAISIIKKTVHNIQWIEVITNADYLTLEKVEKLSQAGCTNMTVSMYDSDISDKIIKLFENTEIKLTLKDCYNGFEIVNRIEIMNKNEKLNINRPCYLPFYKMFIDSDGDVIVCSNDWKRDGVVGNILSQSLQDIWLGDKIKNYRSELENGNRKSCEPCKYCNINGIMFGEDSFNTWKQHAKSINL